ncbi:hypothetical protein [uncultured Jatrophihabitans sp.]|uniref:hypothetical protein n=1 Tax=uncultured Jatrophihabitans sp. TaxID=1610747 RepID=UPI0035CC8EAE
MADPQPDLAFQLADRLLGHILDRLAAADATPGRAFVCAERTIPADDCCDGLVWTRVASIVPTNGDVAQDRSIRPAGDLPVGHAIRLEAGHLRCAPSPVDEGGAPPDPAEYTASAITSSVDRAAVRYAIECDLPADLLELQCDAQVVDQWAPLNAAGCAGGFITTSIVVTMVN